MKKDTNVILIQKPGTKYSAIGFFIAAGSAREKHKSGMAHLLEHVIYANPTTLKLEAETQLEYMAFYSTQLSNETPRALKELYDYLFSTPLREKNVAIQAKRIELELQTAFQSSRFKKVYDCLFGKNSVQSRGWSGSAKDIKSITFDELVSFKNRTFNLENLVVVVAGDFNQIDVENAVRELKLEREIIPQSFRQANITEKKMVWRTYSDGSIADVDVFLPASSLYEYEDRIQDVLFSAFFVKNADSYLSNFLYRELGNAYYVDSGVLHWGNGGVSVFGYRTFFDQAEETTDKVYELISKLPTSLTRDMFDSARKSLLLQFAIDENNPEHLVRQLGEDLLLTGRIFSTQEQITILNKLTYEDFAKKVEHLARLPVVVVKE